VTGFIHSITIFGLNNHFCHVNIERSGDKYIAHADIDATVPADFDVRKVETSDE